MPHSIQRLLPFAVVSALLTGAAGCGDGTIQQSPKQSSQQVELDGHDRMLELLSQAKERINAEHSDIGNAAYVRAIAQLNELADDALPERISLQSVAGWHALRLGDTKQAIDHFETTLRLVSIARSNPQAFRVNENKFELFVFLQAVANLRLGETENCVECLTSESCLLPITAGGVHQHPAGSRAAVKHLKTVLEVNPDHLKARWLLNIAAMTLGEYPDRVPKELLIPPEAFESEEAFPRFVNVAADLGLDTLTLSGGSIVDDFDDDGFLDLVVSTTHPGGQLRYFHNDGDGSFSEQTEAAGLTGLFGGLNIIQADYDGDGDIDIFVLRGGWLGESGKGHPNSLLRNDGRGRFRDVTFEAGLGEFHFPTQTAAWSDFDNDGDLDLYIGNERFPCQLFENQGDGSFRDIARRAGVENGRFTKGVVWGDYDGDRYPDLYVSNLSGYYNLPESEGKNRLYHNNGDGTFTDVAEDLGVERPYSSFPVWFWDFNNDGLLDIFSGSCLWSVEYVAADYLGLPHDAEPDALYQGIGDGKFREVAVEKNLTRVTHPMGSNFGDLDNDGFLDFYLGTGNPEYEGLMPNLMFHNRAGQRFTNVTTAGGFGHLQKGHGISFADFDHDGDQDVFAELGGAYAGDAFGNALFENPGFENHWIVVKLVGEQSNRYGIGARIRVELEEQGQRRSIYRWVDSGGSFGANPLRQHIGIGTTTKINLLEVYWPTTDTYDRFSDVAADQFLEIREGNPAYRKLDYKRAPFQRARPAVLKSLVQQRR